MNQNPKNIKMNQKNCGGTSYFDFCLREVANYFDLGQSPSRGDRLPLFLSVVRDRPLKGAGREGGRSTKGVRASREATNGRVLYLGTIEVLLDSSGTK